MRCILRVTICVTVLAALALTVGAQSKETKLTGKITCAKCDLKVEKNCATVIVVSENGTDQVYYLDQKSAKANHDAICQLAKQGSVTGTISENDGKKTITATKVEFQK